MVFRVETDDLDKKATEIDIEMAGMPKPDNAIPTPPCAHPVAVLAAGRLDRISANPKLAQDRGIEKDNALPRPCAQ